MSRDSTLSTAASVCAALVTSKVSGVTRRSGWAKGWRVPAYTRVAPLLKASSTSACPRPRLAPVTRTALPSIAIAFALMTASLSCESLSLVEGLASTRRRSREGDLDRPHGVGCERGQAPRANVVWTRCPGRISTRSYARTAPAASPPPHSRRTGWSSAPVVLVDRPHLAGAADPLGAARPMERAGPAGAVQMARLRRRNDEGRRCGEDDERWRRDGSIHAAGVPTGGRPGGAGRARAGDADVRGAAPQPARGGAAGGRPAPAFHGERDVGAC